MARHMVRNGTALFIIDPQNDFMGEDGGAPYAEGSEKAALRVIGAVSAMRRLAARIRRDAARIAAIYVTLDTHEAREGDIDIGHPAFWRAPDASMPAPLTTLISFEDFASKKWVPYLPQFDAEVGAYLKAAGPQVVWTRHCVFNTWGHLVQKDLREALEYWEQETGGRVIYVHKGMYPLSEQYGVFEASVPSPKDPSTWFNWLLLDSLLAWERVLVAGVATDFCVKTSVEQAAAKMTLDEARRWTLLVDAMADVNLDGTGKAATGFLDAMRKAGMRLADTAQRLAA